MFASFHTRCIILCSILVIGLSVLSGRLVQIQLVDRHHYAANSRKAFHRVEKLPAIRGMIVDRREEPLAKSIPVSTVYVDKNHLYDAKLASYGLAYRKASEQPGWNQLDAGKQRKKIDALRGEILACNTADAIVKEHLSYTVDLLARPLGMQRKELRDKIEMSKGIWVPIAKDLPEDVIDPLREAVDTYWIQGFEFQHSIKRWYTAPNLATHLIGFTGEDVGADAPGNAPRRVVGKFGVEASMETYLAGR
ncbi:MAG: hypothetical protein RLZZ282_1224, partial [Verrucomicrobiota bacterium]